MSYQSALSLISRGRANPSDFIVQLPPKVVREYSPSQEISSYLSYFTRAITIPSSTNSVLNLVGQENVGIGRNVVTGRQFGSPVVMTFSDRSDLLVYQTIKNWMDASVINADQQGSNRSLRVQYYDNIKSDVFIYKTEPKRNVSGPNTDYFRGHLVTGMWQLINCIPLAIEQTTLSVEAADSLLDFTMSVAYESYSFAPMMNKDLSEVINPYGSVVIETDFAKDTPQRG